LRPIWILPGQTVSHKRLADVHAVDENSAQQALVPVQAATLDYDGLSEDKVRREPLRTGGVGLLPLWAVDTN
jgi:hypothetical protein